VAEVVGAAQANVESVEALAGFRAANVEAKDATEMALESEILQAGHVGQRDSGTIADARAVFSALSGATMRLIITVARGGGECDTV
jgi:hypothetical protein